MTALLWIHALAIRVIDYLTYDIFHGRSWVKKEKKIVPPSAGLRPEEAERPTLPQGYVEPRRTFELREAYVVRRLTPEEHQELRDKLKVQALIRDAGGY
jgi:hypothetical protein